MNVYQTPEYKALHVKLHRMWSAAVGTPKYEKREWKALDAAIHEALTTAMSPSLLQGRQTAKHEPQDATHCNSDVGSP